MGKGKEQKPGIRLTRPLDLLSCPHILLDCTSNSSFRENDYSLFPDFARAHGKRKASSDEIVLQDLIRPSRGPTCDDAKRCWLFRRAAGLTWISGSGVRHMDLA